MDIDPDHLTKDTPHFLIRIVVPLLFGVPIEVSPVTSALPLDMLGHCSRAHSKHRRVRIVFQLILTQKSI